MLQSLRRASQSYVAKLLFGVLLLSFALWGMGPVFSGTRVSNVAKAGSVSISSALLDSAYRQEIQNIEQQYGLQITPEMASKLGMKLQIARRLVMETLYDQESSKLGVVLGEETIRQTIAAQPNLRDENGKFSPARFQKLLQIVGMSETQYVTALRRDLTRTVLMGAVRAGAIVPETLAHEMYAYAHETRSVDGFFVDSASMKVNDPSDDDLKAYYDGHQEDYRAPEFRTLDYLMLDIASLKAQVNPGEEELRAAYDEAPDRYGVPEKRSILQVTTNDEALARAIAADAQKSGSLKEAADAHNQMAVAAPDLAKGSVIPQLDQVIFSLEPNKPSDAVKSPIGWHVIEVTKVEPAQERSFAEVRDDVLDQVKLATANDKASEMVTSLEDMLAGGSTLEEAAKALGLTVQHVGPVSKDGKTPEGGLVEGEDHVVDVVQNGFSVGAGETSPVTEADGTYFAVRASQVDESHVRSLDEVKDAVKTAWLSHRREEAAFERAGVLADALKMGEETRSVVKIGPFDRQGTGANGGKVELDDSTVEAVFAAPQGEILTTRTKDGAWAVRVSKVVPVSFDGVDLAPVQAAMRSGYANDILEQYSNALRSTYGVTINEKALAQ